ncbi:alpha/beta fold hydrolase [Haloactinomyces albus]|uniref:Pimeloyl-ACP methyl ester carboxylesterase n=1 Tax=Haloactinomyces albus TaxID=1352928 RepID=A0AAE3ZJ95_9ACTN|nr:alpha/beta hydrolase [Haloactinomyces albus]MDR7304658.1 pimeloyl-ACP methyl ester carboxylesterase [Haloactinomyces albus]
MGRGSGVAVPVRRGTVAVDGAELYYETRGAGRPVLLIQGGLSEAGTTEQIAEELARHYQVISYDRRGLSRSTVSGDDATAPTTMGTHADDAAALLAAVVAQPALVVGPSIGAVIGLYLALRHPERVAMLVAHEPPMLSLVSDARQETGLAEVAELARHDVHAAIQHFVSFSGNEPGTAEAGAQAAPQVGDVEANLRRFFAHDFPAVRDATVDTARLGSLSASARIVPTGGEQSRGRWEYRCAERLADALDRPMLEMPGGHNGLVSHPWAGASALGKLFTKPHP